MVRTSYHAQVFVILSIPPVKLIIEPDPDMATVKDKTSYCEHYTIYINYT